MARKLWHLALLWGGAWARASRAFTPTFIPTPLGTACISDYCAPMARETGEAHCKQHSVEGNVLYGHLQTLDYESCWASLQEIYTKPMSRIQINHRLPSTHGADSSTDTVSSVLPGWTPQARNHPITDRPYRHGTCCNNHLLRLKPTTEKPRQGTTNHPFFTPPIPPMVGAPSSTSIRTTAQAL